MAREVALVLKDCLLAFLLLGEKEVRSTIGNGITFGNVHLKWSFSEAAVTFMRGNRRFVRIVLRMRGR